MKGRSAETLLTDKHWRDQCNKLQEFMTTNKGCLPTIETNATLHRWLSNMKKRHKDNPLSAHWAWRVPMLTDLGIDIGASGRTPNPNSWLRIIGVANLTPKKDQMDWLRSLSLEFNCDKASECGSITEYVIKSLNIKDVNSKDCTREKPVFDIRHTLSYIVKPFSSPDDCNNIIPTWKLFEDSPSAETVPR